MALPPTRYQVLTELLLRIGFEDLTQINWELMDLALTHPSLDRNLNNDRLEFFGDSVLRMAVTAFLYETYPDLSVGSLSTIRSDLISDAHLVELAEVYDLEAALAMSPNAQHDRGGRTRRLADAFEALLGALYLSWSEQAIPYLRVWLDPFLQDRAIQVIEDPTHHNAKAALQELTQRVWGCLPDYQLVGSQEHPPWFQMEVWSQGQCWGFGEGRSKKVAEVAAAGIAFKAIRQCLGEEVSHSNSANISYSTTLNHSS